MSVFLERVLKLQNELSKENIDAALIYDRENLIYFVGATDLEGCALCVPQDGIATLFCIHGDEEHIGRINDSVRVVPYVFPMSNVSAAAASWLKSRGSKAPRVGFTRYFISTKDYMCLIDAVPDMVVCDISAICYKLRALKSKDELERIYKAAGFLKIGMSAAEIALQYAVTEVEVLAEAEYAMRKAGSEGSPFRMQVLSKSRQMMIHPYASQNIIENNGPVVVHIGATYEGYCAKMCRTFFVGEPDPESVRIYDVLKETQETAFQMIKPGITCGELFDATYECISRYDYEKYWEHHIGYGVGIRQSEFYPIIAKGSQVALEENMVIDILLPTIRKPLVGGPRITDTVLITSDGARYLTEY